MGIEIERKFLVRSIPANLSDFLHHEITQAYICTNPVIRVRKQDQEYYMTYKGEGMLSRTEYNLPLNEEAYLHLLRKSDGNVISKTRYEIPVDPGEINTECLEHLKGAPLIVELDIFDAPFAPLILAEIEFPNQEAADAFSLLPWFLEDVTQQKEYHNSNMSKRTLT